jgi:ribulose-phosphate 3-epimerase
MHAQRVKIAPSLLSADFARLGEEARALEAAGADYIHIDVMDGHFVPNLTIGPAVVKALRPWVRIPLDVHLMIAPPDPFIAAFAEAGADIITFHPEAGPHPHRTAQLIKSFGKRAGLALSPMTPLSTLDHALGIIDLVLVMTVNPGFGGQSFIEDQLDKIANLRRKLDETECQRGRRIELEVDGGINPQTAAACLAAGAETLVAGAAIFTAGPDYARTIRSLRGPDMRSLTSPAVIA